MLNRSRVSGALDVQRLGQALARPGMDTRNWVVLASVVRFFFDPDHGPFCDVLILPDGNEETVRVGALYAGPGFGFYVPLAPDDEVLVCFPSGDPNHGGVIVSRAWSASDPPPAPANNNQADLLLYVEKDKTLRIQTQGSGNIVVAPESGKVLLGAETGTQPVARKTDAVNLGTMTVAGAPTGIQTITITGPDGTTQAWSVASPGPFSIPSGEISEGSSNVEAKD